MQMTGKTVQVVIEIPEGTYDLIKHNVQAQSAFESAYYAIRRGTVLPKGHGRLVDADELEQRLEYDMRDADKRCDFYRVDRISTAANYVADTETIIEADKEGAEE